MDSLNDTLAKLASSARTLYNSHSQTLTTANNILKASKANTNGMDPNAVQSPDTPSPPAITAEPPILLPDFDPSNPQAILDALSTFNAQTLDDAVMKIGSNSRKYLKLSKEYRWVHSQITQQMRLPYILYILASDPRARSHSETLDVAIWLFSCLPGTPSPSHGLLLTVTSHQLLNFER